MFVKPLHPEKAPSLTDVTEEGMVMRVRPLQPENACHPMEVTEFGMMVFLQPTISVFVPVSMMALQFSRESYIGFSLSTEMLDNPLQPENSPLTMDVTE